MRYVPSLVIVAFLVGSVPLLGEEVQTPKDPRVDKALDALYHLVAKDFRHADALRDFADANHRGLLKAAQATRPEAYRGPFQVQLLRDLEKANDGAQTTQPTTVNILVKNNAPRGVSDLFVFHHTKVYGDYQSPGEKSPGVTGNVLTNDWEPDGEGMTIVPGDTGLTGLTLNSDGSFTYQPDHTVPHPTGTFKFQYQITDGADKSETVQATIQITDAAPVALSEVYRVLHGQTVTTGSIGSNSPSLLANDIDTDTQDKAKLTVEILSQVDAKEGTFTQVGKTGDFTFVPTKDFVGDVGITYRVFDGAKWSGSTTSTITVVNHEPLPIVDHYYGVKRGRIEISDESGVLKNDVDPDDTYFPSSKEKLQAVLVTPPERGWLTKIGSPTYQEFIDNPWGTITAEFNQSINLGGGFVYIPNMSQYLPGFGFDSFTYKVTDGVSESGATTVMLSIQGPPMHALGDAYSMIQGNGDLVVPAGGVLTNDWSFDGAKVAKKVTEPANGKVTLTADGGFTYTPNAGFSGTDTFTYVVVDNANTPVGQVTDDQKATVKIRVAEFEPVDLEYTIKHDRRQVGNLLESISVDADERVTVKVESDVKHGIVILRPDGSYLYQPDLGYKGTDSFTYSLWNGTQEVNKRQKLGRIDLEIKNADVVANDDFYGVTPGKPFIATYLDGVMSNDNDPDSDHLTVTAFSGTIPGGSLTLREDGSFSFFPNDDMKGSTSYTYELSDGISTKTAVMKITMTDNNPNAAEKEYYAYHDQKLTVSRGDGLIQQVGFGTDERFYDLVAKVVEGGGPTKASSFTLNEDGSFDYKGITKYHGDDSFTYYLEDPAGNKSEARKITIHVENDLEQLWYAWGAAKWYGVAGTPITGDLTRYNLERDGDTRSVKISGATPDGLSLAADGTFTYTGDTSVSFEFTVSDGVETSSYAYKASLNVLESFTGASATLGYGDILSTAAGQIINGSANKIVATFTSPTQASATPVAGGTDYGVSAELYSEDAVFTWNGSVPGRLGIYSMHDVSFSGNVGTQLSMLIEGGDLRTDISIDGHLILNDPHESWNYRVLGNLKAASIRAGASQFQDIETAGELDLIGDWHGGGGRYHFDPASGVGTIGKVTAGKINFLGGTTAGQITATGDINGIYVNSVDQSISGGGDINVVIAQKNIAASVTAAGDITKIKSGGEISGNITGDAISSIEAGASISGDMLATQRGIGSLYTGETLTGDVTATEAISIVTVGQDVGKDVTISGRKVERVIARGNIAGTINAKGTSGQTSDSDILQIEAGADLSGKVKSQYGGIGMVTAKKLTTDARIQSVLGRVDSVKSRSTIEGESRAGKSIYEVVAPFSINAIINAGENITNIEAGTTVENQITAGDDLVTVKAGGVISAKINAGSITGTGLQGGILSAESVTGDITVAESITMIRAGQNVSSDINAGKNIGLVYAGQNVTGLIEAGQDISEVISGDDITGDIVAGGKIVTVKVGELVKNYGIWESAGYIPAGGNIIGSYIYAQGDVQSVSARRDINPVTGPSSEPSIKSSIWIESAGASVGTVEADALIDATIIAKTNIGTVSQSAIGAGHIKGTITAIDGNISRVESRFGNIEANITAGQDITQVIASEDITGKITASKGIGPRDGSSLVAGKGVNARNGKIDAKITAVEDIGGVTSGKDLDGSVKGRNLLEIRSGMTGGGSINADITATQTLTLIIAEGTWGKDTGPAVYSYEIFPDNTVDYTPGTDKVALNKRPKPPAAPMVAANTTGLGSINGLIDAKSIGRVVAYGNIEQDINVPETLGPVWAMGYIQGAIAVGQGNANVQSWSKVFNITTTADASAINLTAYGEAIGGLKSGGTVDVTSWSTIRGAVDAPGKKAIWAYDNIEGKVTGKGPAVMRAMSDATSTVEIQDALSKSAKNISSPKTTARVISEVASDFVGVRTVLAFTAKVWMISFGDMQGGIWEFGVAASNNAPTMGFATTNMVAFGSINIRGNRSRPGVNCSSRRGENWRNHRHDVAADHVRAVVRLAA